MVLFIAILSVIILVMFKLTSYFSTTVSHTRKTFTASNALSIGALRRVTSNKHIN